MTDVALVVPCYNEARRLDLDRFRDFARRAPGTRFIFVNDGSTDGTGPMLEGFCQSAPDRFRVLYLPVNRGKAEAVRQGVLLALSSRPEYVGYWDADLATPLEAVQQFVTVLDEGPDIVLVMGARVQLLGRTIERKWVRHYLGRVFATAASQVLALPVYDTQCGAKLFRASPEMAALFADPFRTRWLFDVELLARLSRGRRGTTLPPAEAAVYELPLKEWRDVAGSKLRPRDFILAVREMDVIRRTYKRGKLPQRRVGG